MTNNFINALLWMAFATMELLFGIDAVLGRAKNMASSNLDTITILFTQNHKKIEIFFLVASDTTKV